MKTTRKPGPQTDADTQTIKAWQKAAGIQEDGKWGHQSTGQWIIQRAEAASEIRRLKGRIAVLYAALAAGFLGGVGMWGSM